MKKLLKLYKELSNNDLAVFYEEDIKKFNINKQKELDNKNIIIFQHGYTHTNNFILEANFYLIKKNIDLLRLGQFFSNIKRELKETKHNPDLSKIYDRDLLKFLLNKFEIE